MLQHQRPPNPRQLRLLRLLQRRHQLHQLRSLSLRLRPSRLRPQRQRRNVPLPLPRRLLPPRRALRRNNLCVQRILRRAHQANIPRHARAERRLRKRARSSQVHSRKQRAPALPQLRLARSNLFVLCPRETVDQFPELPPVIVIVGPVALVPASRCARNNPAVRADVRLHRVLVDLEVQADPAEAARSVSAQERRLPALVRAPARRVLVRG